MGNISLHGRDPDPNKSNCEEKQLYLRPLSTVGLMGKPTHCNQDMTHIECPTIREPTKYIYSGLAFIRDDKYIVFRNSQNKTFPIKRIVGISDQCKYENKKEFGTRFLLPFTYGNNNEPCYLKVNKNTLYVIDKQFSFTPQNIEGLIIYLH